jgi:hypothetical protein
MFNAIISVVVFFFKAGLFLVGLHLAQFYVVVIGRARVTLQQVAPTR